MLNAPWESVAAEMRAKKTRRVISDHKEIKVFDVKTAEQVLLESLFQRVQRLHPLIDVLPLKTKEVRQEHIPSMTRLRSLKSERDTRLRLRLILQPR